MDSSCKGFNCQGIEHYCSDPSHSATYFCDCKQARLKHSGHSITTIDLDSHFEWLSKIEKECIQKGRQFTIKADKCIQAILETLEDHNQQLQFAIDQCKEIKQKLISSKSRFETLSKYFSSGKPQTNNSIIRLIDSKVVRKNYFCHFQKQLGFFLTAEVIREFAVSEKLSEFLSEPESFSSLQVKVEKQSEIGLLVCTLPHSKLKSLDLGCNRIGTEGAKTIASGLPKSKLKSLDLRMTQIDAEGAEVLASILPQSQLTSLNLRWNQIQEGVKPLADALCSSEINHLDLGATRIDLDGVKRLASVLGSSKLTDLNLGENQIGPEAAEVLASKICNSTLVSLNLRVNCICIEGVKALSSAFSGSRLTSLNLWDNQINDEAVEVLASALSDSKIITLDLGENYITSQGAKLLAGVLSDSKLAEVHLQFNQICTEGAKAFASALGNSRLTSLDLRWNQIQTEGKRALHRAKSKFKLTNIYC